MPNSKPIGILAKDLGERLARFRLFRNLRQVDLAEQSGISRGAIVRIEAGKPYLFVAIDRASKFAVIRQVEKLIGRPHGRFRNICSAPFHGFHRGLQLRA